MATINLSITPKLKATIYRYAAVFVGFFVIAYELQTHATPGGIHTVQDVWKAALAALPFAIEKFLTVETNVNAAADASPVASVVTPAVTPPAA